jgi:transcriptional regulator with XRE-family HTH domain
MTDTLNPDTLKVLRDLRGWSQDRLAKESKISKSQISRWERGQQTAKIHQNTRERLCQALGVKWDKLTRAVEKPNPNVFRAPLKAGISFPAKTALTVIRYHYGLREEAILDLAPLAFLILAERKPCVPGGRAPGMGAVKGHRRGPTEGPPVSALPLSCRGAFPRTVLQRGTGSPDERKCIEGARCPLRINTKRRRRRGSPPFVGPSWKRALAGTLVLFYKNTRWSSTPFPTGLPRAMRSRRRSSRNGSGLDPQKEEDLAVLRRIQTGDIDLEEVMNKKSEATGEEYRRWLTEQHQTVLAEEKERHALLFGSLTLDLPGVKDKTTGQDNPTTPSDNHQPTEDPA